MKLLRCKAPCLLPGPRAQLQALPVMEEGDPPPLPFPVEPSRARPGPVLEASALEKIAPLSKRDKCPSYPAGCHSHLVSSAQGQAQEAGGWASERKTPHRTPRPFQPKGRLSAFGNAGFQARGPSRLRKPPSSSSFSNTQTSWVQYLSNIYFTCS